MTDVDEAVLVTDAASVSGSGQELLTPRNSGGLVTRCEGVVRVVRAAERLISQSSADSR